MRSVDERVSAVRNRSKRLQRRRSDRMLVALVCLMALPLVGLTGKVVTGDFVMPSVQGASLFGTASLLGSSVGGYVLVAVVSFAAAALVTVVLMMRRRLSRMSEDETYEKENRYGQG